MRKILSILLAICWLVSCNKVVDEVELPPFSTYPNPFSDVLNIYVSDQVGTQTFLSLKVLDGSDKEIVVLGDVIPGGSYQINMAEYEKGVYYVQLYVSGSWITTPVLKAQ